MNKTARALTFLSLPLLLAACGRTATPHSATAAHQAVRLLAAIREASTVPGKWFVELQGDPTAIGGLGLNTQQNTFRAQALRSNIRYQELYSYNQLFNGFSVAASPDEVNRLAHLPGVKAIYPVRLIPMPDGQPETPASSNTALQPDMFYAKNMTGVSIAQNELGLTGKGVKVGVIDTGLNLGHPAFQGRVVSAVDLVGDAYGKDGQFVPNPGSSPQDCAGHGTHVAGIIGGYDPSNTRDGVPFSGVAPGVSFGIYRVFGCSGGTEEDVMVKAMERAYADGMQVVNLSIGSPFENWAETPSAIVGSRMIKKGMIVVASAGNSGANGSYSMGGVSMGDNVISVASVDNLKLELDSMTLSDGSKVGFYTAGGAPVPTQNLSLTVTKKIGSTTTTLNDGCTAAGGFADGSLTGKAVLIRRGSCAFYEKAANAQKAGAAAVILYNNTAGYISPTVTGTPAITIPVISVNDIDGAKIDSLVASGATITFDGGKVAIANPTATSLSSFSSYGMSAELELKPDLAAPGGNIISTYPRSLDGNGYAVLSGTSMASSHIAGAAALMLQARPNLAAKDMRTLLMNSASLRDYRNASGTLFKNVPDYVERQGAGLLDIVGSVTNTVHATPAKLSLGDSATFATREKVVVLHNDDPTLAATYTAYHVPALTVAGTTLAPVPNTATGTMMINGQSADTEQGVPVTVPAGGETELNVVVSPPSSAPDRSQYGGYVYLVSTTRPSLVIPYGGFKGNYQSLPAFGNLIIGRQTTPAPLFADDAADVLYPRGTQPDTMPDYTFKNVNVTDNSGTTSTVFDAPYVIANLAHQVRKITFDLLDQNGTLVTALRTEEYLGRNCSNDLSQKSDSCDIFNLYKWDGRLQDGSNAPAGNYQLRLTALKPLGEEGNAADTEVYTSPVFKVVR